MDSLQGLQNLTLEERLACHLVSDDLPPELHALYRKHLKDTTLAIPGTIIQVYYDTSEVVSAIANSANHQSLELESFCTMVGRVLGVNPEPEMENANWVEVLQHTMSQRAEVLEMF